MGKIEVERKPAAQRLTMLAVQHWPIWTKEVSTFEWTYEETEACYILEGEAVVTPAGGAPVRIGAGDLVTFPEGMTCTWEVKKPIKKHFTFG